MKTMKAPKLKKGGKAMKTMKAAMLKKMKTMGALKKACLLYTSPSPRDS